MSNGSASRQCLAGKPGNDILNLHRWFEVLADVDARRLDLLKVMMAPQKPANRFRWIKNDPVLKSAPKARMFVGWTSEQQVVDVNSKKEPVIWEPKG